MWYRCYIIYNEVLDELISLRVNSKEISNIGFFFLIDFIRKQCCNWFKYRTIFKLYDIFITITWIYFEKNWNSNKNLQCNMGDWVILMKNLAEQDTARKNWNSRWHLVGEVFKNRESVSTKGFILHHQGSPLLTWSIIL